MTKHNARGPIVLAAGGTGGHMFPAEALARELVKRGRPVALITDRRGAAFGTDIGVTIHHIRAAQMGRGLRGKAQTAIELSLGTIGARRLLSELSPSIIVGFGGYPSLPTLFAARTLRLPYVLHEQNAVLGRVNRMFAKHATRIATSFGVVTMVPAEAAGRVVLTGNPVRPAIAGAAIVGYPSFNSDSRLNLLVIGGSQGAHVFSEAVPAALAHMPEHLRQRVAVSQQCRADDLDTARDGFRRINVVPELATFFNDMPARLAGAHLVIARAGASTCAELTVAGRPSVLVPYPFAMDDHQTANAEQLAATGAAWMIPQRALTPMALAARLEALMTLPASLSKAAGAAIAAARPDAAERLADLVEHAALGATGRNTDPSGEPAAPLPEIRQQFSTLSKAAE